MAEASTPSFMIDSDDSSKAVSVNSTKNHAKSSPRLLSNRQRNQFKFNEQHRQLPMLTISNPPMLV
jgi:hypothetical protein